MGQSFVPCGMMSGAPAAAWTYVHTDTLPNH